MSEPVDPELLRASRRHVARRRPELECGAEIGHLAIKLDDGHMEFIVLHCTKSKLHIDECQFVGVELVISRRRREDGGNASLILPGR
jgi:hypothetical protein